MKNRSYTIPLDQVQTDSSVGGKASGLASLLAIGVRVPPAVVVTTNAFADHLREIERRTGPHANLGDLEELVRNTPLKSEIETAVLAAWKSLGSHKVAIRSSATVEDSRLASYAGLFKTVLNVETAAELLSAVRDVWASSLTDVVLKYSARSNPSGALPGVALIIQNQLNPIISGVAFSRDPVSGQKVFYAEWVSGLGDALVSGEKIDGRIWLDGEHRRLRVDHLSKRYPQTDGFWDDVLGMLQKAEEALEVDYGVDLEWALTSSGPYGLQARPITNPRTVPQQPVAEWQLPGVPLGGWTDDQRMSFGLWDEYNDRSVPPLEFALWEAAIWQASLDMFSDGGNGPPIMSHVCMLDDVPIAIDPAGRAPNASSSVMFGKDLGSLETAMALARSLRSRFLSDATLRNKDDESLLQSLHELAGAHRDIHVTRLLHMHEWIDAESDAERAIRGRLNLRDDDPDGESVIEDLRCGIEHRTNEMLSRLSALADAKGCQNFEVEFAAFISDYGHFEFDGILVHDNPSVLRDQIVSTNASVAAEQVRRTRARYENRLKQVTEAITSEATRAELSAAVATLRHWIAVRENTKMDSNLLSIPIKETVIELGHRLTAKGALNNPSQVKLLSAQELSQLMAGHPSTRAASLERREVILGWKQQRSWLPTTFQRAGTWDASGTFHGLPGSPGIATGRARLVDGPEQFSSVQAGDIVVAKATNPVWTQLFGRIKGIVVENGSRLSHAAVTAREYGIPAVVDALGIMGTLKTEESLKIDGSNGDVTKFGA